MKSYQRKRQSAKASASLKIGGMNPMAHHQNVADPHRWTRFLQFLQHRVRSHHLRKGKGPQSPVVTMRVLTQTKVLDVGTAVAADHLAPILGQGQGAAHHLNERAHRIGGVKAIVSKVDAGGV